MTIAQAFNDITIAQGGTPSTGGTITGAIDALNDTLAGNDQKPAQTIEGAIRLLGAHIGGGSAPTGTISITENGEGIDVAQYAYADVNVSGGGGDLSSVSIEVTNNSGIDIDVDGVAIIEEDESLTTHQQINGQNATISAVLYKNYGSLHFYATGGDGIALSVSGNLEEDDGYVDVTGAGAIVITAA